METKCFISQDYNLKWFFCVEYGQFGLRQVAFEVQYHELDFYHAEGFPIYPNHE